MRHRKRRGKLNRTHSHRVAMLSNMACSLIDNEQLVTTMPKAKVLRPYIEKLVTIGKKGTLHARRLAMSRIKRENSVSRLFSVISDRYKDRNGGYIRIMHFGFRKGDQAPMAVIEFVDRDVSAKGAAARENLNKDTALATV